MLNFTTVLYVFNLTLLINVLVADLQKCNLTIFISEIYGSVLHSLEEKNRLC